MFERIIYISDKSANIKLKDSENIAINLMNLHLIFEDKDKKVLGEVDDLDEDVIKARFLGEIIDGKLIGGVIRKPSLDASIRVIDKTEIPMIVGEDKDGYMKFGLSPFYNDYPVFLNVNNFFSNHFAIFGNSGSGKSCGISRLFQNMFQDQRLFPYKANILLFDSSGEYYNAFKNLNFINPNYHYRFFSTNEIDGVGEKLRLPIWLLNSTDLALLLQATNHSQLPIIERMLKLALIFSQNDVDSDKFKDHLIAKAIMTILYTNETSPNKRNEIFSILASCSTPEFNLEAEVKGIGYTRKFRECFLIDNNGQFSESVLLTEYVSSYISDEYDNYEPNGGVFYTLDTLEKALNFTLISEGWLRNENTYGDAVTLRVRLHSLIVGPYAKYFDYQNYISLESYLSSMLIEDGRKYQLININLDDVDDDFAKVITKIYSRIFFEFSKGLKDRTSIPFHIIVEEAHRYIQNDTDRFLIGYNIFERIAKEGRKYGVLLGLISQRPVELSDTVISQCSNFLIFKMNHPTDVDYIRKMVPNISDEIVEKQKTLQSGTCLGFGSAFKIPLIVKLEMPNPAPWSGNCDVVKIWNGNGTVNSSINTNADFSKTNIPQSMNISQNTDNFNGINNLNNNSGDTLSKLVSFSDNNDLKDNSIITNFNNNGSNFNVFNENSTNSFGNDNLDKLLGNTLSNENSTNNSDNDNLDKLLGNVSPNENSTNGFDSNDLDKLLNSNMVNNSSENININNSKNNNSIQDLNIPNDLKINVDLNNSFDIPSEIEIANNKPSLVPTIEDKVNALEDGSVRIVPPSDNFNLDSVQPLFTKLDNDTE